MSLRIYRSTVRLFVLATGCFAIFQGCNDESKPSPPPNYLGNTTVNEITERENLVVAFGTAEVMPIPASSHEFMVRDTNGVVWYVNCQSNPGSTRMFGWHEEFPKPTPLPIALQTNVVTETNVVTLTNHIVEDPITYKSFEK